MQEDQIAGTTDSERLGTKWLTFYPYYSFVVAILAVSKAAVMMTEGDGPVGLLVLGPFAVFVAAVGFGLLWREVWGWKANWIFLFFPLAIVAPLTIGAVTMSFMGRTVGAHTLLTLYISLAIQVAWVWPNYVYFRKRRSLFGKVRQATG
jgi:hypothetical protein